MGHVHRAASAVADVAHRSAHPRGRLDQAAGFSRRAGAGRQSRASRPPAPHAADRAGGAGSFGLIKVQLSKIFTTENTELLNARQREDTEEFFQNAFYYKIFSLYFLRVLCGEG